MFKKVSLVCYALVLASSLLFSGCKKGNKLEYKSLGGTMWLSADVIIKGTKKRVMWFQFFDRIDKREDAVNHYANQTEKVAGFPASISKNNFVWVLINNRFEIRLVADSKNKLYQNTEKLKKFIMAFDIKAMAKYQGEQKLSPDELKKFVPKLAMAN